MSSDDKKADAAPAAAAKDDKPAAAAAAADEADKKDEKKAPKAKKAATGKKTRKQILAEAPLLVEDPAKELNAAPEILGEKTRDRKSIKKPEAGYVPPDWTVSKSVEIPEGKGTALGEIANVEKALGKVSTDAKELSALHSLLFGSKGTKSTRRAHIRKFNGFDVSKKDEQQPKKLASLGTSTVDSLKMIAAILDVETSGSKAELADRIVDFLYKPKASGKDYKFSATKGTKRKSSKSKSGKKSKSKDKKSKDDKPKRGPNAYMLFANAKRASVQEKNKDLKMTEVAQELGKMWKALTDSEQQKWKDKAAAAAPAGSSKSKSKSPKKSKKSKKESGSDSDSGSSSSSSSESESDEEDKKKKKKAAEKKAKKEKKDKKDKKKDKSPSKKKKAAKGDDSDADKSDEEPKKKKAKTDKKEKPEKKKAAAAAGGGAFDADGKIKAATKKAVEDGDDSVSNKSVLTALKAQFGEDIILKNKDAIKEWILKFFEDKQSKMSDS